MPIDPSIIVAGAGALGQAANAVSQGRTNKKTREWNERMYSIQKHDNIAQWHMQNAYNTPEAQMKRLSEAGLNPNLVYGHGQAVQPAGSIDSASAPTWSPRAPQVDLQPIAAGGITAYYDVQMKQAQIDNMKTQNTVLTNEALLKLAQMASLEAGTSSTRLDVALKGGLFQNSLEMAYENLRKLRSESSLAHTNARWSEQNAAQNYEKGEKTIQNLVSDLRLKDRNIQGAELENKMKQLEIDLRKNGINPNDPMYMRILGRILGDKFNLKDLL